MFAKRPSTTGANSAATQPARIPHRPHVEYFDISELSKTDARGFVHPVDSCHVEPFGLYLVCCADAPPNRYSETWVLPELSIQVTMHHANAGHDRDPVYHIYVGEFARIEPKRWRGTYHYIDIVARNGRVPELRGVDELFAAHAAGHIDAATAQQAFERATAVVDGIASHDHNFERWLASRGIRLTWL
ncbi:hypothetical protein NDR87_35540 [Nocardia sp. CDC159]|uniref:DUF402 domain-containing protein n=1 Tax=Nocardia pulmonis TaxID=2951408 RepID=A0A9X2EDH1_9NOCA|nr:MULTISPECIES: hypothetical protein [Nocardia]MCM6778802.1 hypothetical protein [Nocardia pulmonis]MCM6791691.1 hypothetical protein [Nocardia sp. CDC159]